VSTGRLCKCSSCTNSIDRNQRPLGCAQAPDIFGFGDFACFAAMAGHVDAAARTAAIAILTTNLMEGPRKYRPKRN
jgi:hypothetical protein